MDLSLVLTPTKKQLILESYPGMIIRAGFWKKNK